MWRKCPSSSSERLRGPLSRSRSPRVASSGREVPFVVDWGCRTVADLVQPALPRTPGWSSLACRWHTYRLNLKFHGDLWRNLYKTKMRQNFYFWFWLPNFILLNRFEWNLTGRTAPRYASPCRISSRSVNRVTPGRENPEKPRLRAGILLFMQTYR